MAYPILWLPPKVALTEFMSYRVLARKWRPRTFSELVGQEHVVRALVNGLDHGRLHHAFLFTGTRGVGKTTIARVFAKSLNCQQGVSSTPCGECDACQEIAEGRFVDLIEVDAASRTKVEDTRELLDNVQYAPARGRYKIYLIDEVHMLSGHSFNALLKTLEEPPPHVKFLLATTDPHKLPVTVLSRCLQFNLKRLSVGLIQSRLAHILEREHLEFEVEALRRLARAADGSMRDALSLLDQALAYGGGRVSDTDVRIMLGTIDKGHIFRILHALGQSRGSDLLNEVARMAEQSLDFGDALRELAAILHRVGLIQIVPEAAETEDREDHEQMLELAKVLNPEEIQLYYQIAISSQAELALAPDPRSGFEMALLRMLAFRPEHDARQAVISNPESHQAKSATRALQSTPAGRDEATQSHRDSESKSEPPSSGTEPARDENGTSQAMVAPVSGESVRSGEDWMSIVDTLDLGGGLARELANNCEFLGREGDSVRLRLAPEHANLRSNRVEERLRLALEHFFGNPVSLEISLGEPEVETPAQHNLRRSVARKQEAARAIREDANVQALIDRFGAKIVEESIEGLDSSVQDSEK